MPRRERARYLETASSASVLVRSTRSVSFCAFDNAARVERTGAAHEVLRIALTTDYLKNSVRIRITSCGSSSRMK
jgi:hypothetical protein